jgi:hypothetical protein
MLGTRSAHFRNRPPKSKQVRIPHLCLALLLIPQC